MLNALTLVLAVGLSASEQRATSVRFEAPAECPDVTAFRTELGARTEVVRFVEREEDASMRVAVKVERRASRFEAVLDVELEGARTRKKVNGPKCQTLLSALTLTAALLVDAQAKLVLVPIPTPTPTPIPPEVPAVSVEPTVEVVPVAEQPPEPTIEPPPAVTAPAATQHASLQVDLRAGGWLSSGVSGELDFGGGGRVVLDWPVSPAFALSAGVAAGGLSGRTVSAAAGRVRYAPRFVAELLAGTSWRATEWLQLTLAAFVQANPVFVEGLDADITTSSQRLLWAVGPSVDLSVSRWDWVVGVRGGATFALTLEHFILEPRGVVFSVPPVAVTVGLELGRRF